MNTSRETSQQPSNRDLLIADSDEQGAFFDLVRVASRLEGELNRVFRPYDLTTATYSILSILERVRPEGLSCGDIAGQLIAEVPDMTRLLDRLERLEYVVRERSALDRRMVKVKVTARGSEAVHSLRSAVQDCHKRQFAALGGDRIGRLRDILSALGREGQEEPEPANPTDEFSKRQVGAE